MLLLPGSKLGTGWPLAICHILKQRAIRIAMNHSENCPGIPHFYHITIRDLYGRRIYELDDMPDTKPRCV